MRTIFIGRFIDTPGPNELRIRKGAALVSSNDGHGVIEKLNWDAKNESDAKAAFGLDPQDTVDVVVQTEGESRFWFPGFIDTHIHAPQYPNAGLFGKTTLLDWLKQYTFPLESSLGSLDSPMYSKNASQQTPESTSTSTSPSTHPKSPPDPLQRARTVYSRIITRTLSNGTTTAAYYATIHVPATNLLAKLAFQRGQRAYIGRVCMDRTETCPDFYRDDSTEDTIAKTTATIDYCHGLDPTSDLIAPIITPRFAPSCTSPTLSALAQLADAHNLRIQTHISENTNELALVADLFPDNQHYTHVYSQAGLLTPRTILAHAIHLTEPEIQMIKASGAKISHCPVSNSALGSGLCPVRKWLDSGLEVGLGTDVSGGYAASILESARHAILVSRQVAFLDGGNAQANIGFVEALWLATVGGARVVGMQTRLGLFQEGMLWDVQEISAGYAVGNGRDDQTDTDHTSLDFDPNLEYPVDMFGWEDWEEKVAKWVWNGDDRNVKKVWVGGRLVHKR